MQENTKTYILKPLSVSNVTLDLTIKDKIILNSAIDIINAYTDNQIDLFLLEKN